ncbi:MAG: GIY-YIG nuclease family protein [Planctomycetaceae bacterium]
MNDLQRLQHLGFAHCGAWQFDGVSAIDFALHFTPEGKNVLYAFVSDTEILYVGKTVQGLHKRLYGYKRPGPTQSTNIHANSLILKRLSNSSVEIYVWACDGLMTYGGFRVDLAAGLEDAIVHDLQPVWNKRK